MAIIRHGISAADVYNASMNGWFVVDARPVSEVAAGSVAGAEHVDVRPWELPDDPRHAAVLVSEGDASALAAALGRLAEYSAVQSVGVCSALFSAFAARFPFAVTGPGGGLVAGVEGMPCMPAAIAEGLWLGAAMHAERPAVLAALGVRHVVCVMDDPGGCVPGGAVAVQRWPWVDSPLFRIMGDLDAVAAAIEAARRAGGVLVHCFQGKSRSAAAVLAWMVAARGGGGGGGGAASVDALHAELQGHRALVQVNDGFLEQLRAWAAARRPPP